MSYEQNLCGKLKITNDKIRPLSFSSSPRHVRKCTLPPTTNVDASLSQLRDPNIVLSKDSQCKCQFLNCVLKVANAFLSGVLQPSLATLVFKLQIHVS